LSHRVLETDEAFLPVVLVVEAVYPDEEPYHYVDEKHAKQPYHAVGV
jgi:hypothetical protein